jgi:hypothetical protein
MGMGRWRKMDGVDKVGHCGVVLLVIDGEAGMEGTVKNGLEMWVRRSRPMREINTKQGVGLMSVPL